MAPPASAPSSLAFWAGLDLPHFLVGSHKANQFNLALWPLGLKESRANPMSMCDQSKAGTVLCNDGGQDLSLLSTGSKKQEAQRTVGSPLIIRRRAGTREGQAQRW